MKKNNHGFTLIELIVAIAIFMIVSTVVFQFVVTAANSYQRQSRDVELQYEAQLTMNQLQDMLVDANKGVSYTFNSAGNYLLTDNEIGDTVVSDKRLTIYNKDKYFIIQWNASEQKLVYSEYRWDEDQWKKTADQVLMADYIGEFSVDLSKYEQNQSVTLDIMFVNQKEYHITQGVTLRNCVVINQSLNDIYTDR